MCFPWRNIVIIAIGLTVSMNSHGSEQYHYLNIKEVIFTGQFKQIIINTHQSSDVVVENITSGDNLSFQKNGDMLSVKTVNNNTRSSRIVNGNITNIVVGKNASSMISIGGVEGDTGHDDQPPAEVSLSVPKGINLRLEGNIINAKIGDISGNLLLDIGGKGKIEVGVVHDVSARLAGATFTHILRAVGDLQVDMAGAGKLNIDDGEIGSLAVVTAGASSVNVNAMVDKANIKVAGAGNVRVKQVRTKPDVSIRGAGHVEIGND